MDHENVCPAMQIERTTPNAMPQALHLAKSADSPSPSLGVLYPSIRSALKGIGAYRLELRYQQASITYQHSLNLETIGESLPFLLIPDMLDNAILIHNQNWRKQKRRSST